MNDRLKIKIAIFSKNKTKTFNLNGIRFITAQLISHLGSNEPKREKRRVFFPTFHFVFRRFIFLKLFNSVFFLLFVSHEYVFCVFTLVDCVKFIYSGSFLYNILFSGAFGAFTHTHKAKKISRVSYRMAKINWNPRKKNNNGNNTNSDHHINKTDDRENETVSRLSRLNTLFEFTEKKECSN